MNLIQDSAYILGRWISSSSEISSFDVLNPSTGEVIGVVPELCDTDFSEDIAKVHLAQKKWARTKASSRIKILNKWMELLKSNRTELSELISNEQGKPLNQAEGEVDSAVDYCLAFLEALPKVQTNQLISNDPTLGRKIVHRPVGTIAAITPWNFPLVAVVVKCFSAITAGCAIILKPSEETPLSALAFAKLADEAGLPAGVLNVLTTKNPAKLLAPIISDPLVRQVSFTGSTKTGKLVLSQTANTTKRTQLELGGNGAFMAFEDCDIEEATDAILGCRFYNSGQICVGANRIFVHGNIYDKFAASLTIKVNKMTHSKTGDMGPLINEQAIQKIDSLISDAVAKGATVEAGGSRIDQSLCFKPTILLNVNEEMRVYQEEIFGPVACLYRFNCNSDELFHKTNQTEQALAAYVYSGSNEIINQAAAQLEFGMIGLNSTDIFGTDVPFGGCKQSGLGREGGLHPLEEFYEPTFIAIKTP